MSLRGNHLFVDFVSIYNFERVNLLAGKDIKFSRFFPPN